MRVGSLFCGIGGMDLGLRGGFEIPWAAFPASSTSLAWAYDCDNASIATQHLCMSPIALRQRAEDLSGEDVPKVDVLVADLPSMRWAPDQVRPPRRWGMPGTLMGEVLRILQLCDPEVVMVTNVSAGAVPPRPDRKHPLAAVAEELQHLGYFPRILHLQGSHYVPQHFTYSLVLAGKHRPSEPFPARLWVPPALDAIQGALPGAPLRGTSRTPIVPLRDGKYPGLRLHQGHPVRHPHEPRSLTIPELTRLMGFPDWFHFPEGLSPPQQRQLLSLTTPPPIAWALAQCIEKTLRSQAARPTLEA